MLRAGARDKRSNSEKQQGAQRRLQDIIACLPHPARNMRALPGNLPLYMHPFPVPPE